MRNSSFWSVTVPRAMSIYANMVFAVLWVAFVTALIVNRGWLDVFWNWLQALPSAPRIIIWVLFLPITAGLWIWESSWTTPARSLGFIGIAVWTLLAVSSLIKAFR